MEARTRQYMQLLVTRLLADEHTPSIERACEELDRLMRQELRKRQGKSDDAPPVAPFDATTYVYNSPHDSEHAQIKRRFADLQQQIEGKASSANIEGLNKRIDWLAGHVDTVEGRHDARLETHAGELERYREVVNDLADTVRELETKVEDPRRCWCGRLHHVHD